MAKSIPSQQSSVEKSDAQFRAVVKRLLDTPPMHKPAKAPGKTRKPARTPSAAGNPSE